MVEAVNFVANLESAARACFALDPAQLCHDLRGITVQTLLKLALSIKHKSLDARKITCPRAASPALSVVRFEAEAIDCGEFAELDGGTPGFAVYRKLHPPMAAPQAAAFPSRPW